MAAATDALRLHGSDDPVTAIEGRSVDAELMRGYFAALPGLD